MKQLSNRKIRNICDEIITHLEQRSIKNHNYLCLELKNVLFKRGYQHDVYESKLCDFIPKFTNENAIKYANGIQAKDNCSAWWYGCELEKTFNFDDRIKFMKWLKSQYSPKQNPFTKWFKKVFKIIPVLLLGVTLITSCTQAFDTDKCYENVQKAFPNSKILRSDNYKYVFIVVDDSNNVFLVRTDNITDAEVSSITPFK